jgi:PQQ-dependent dehydrogenase (methanol/ethanol family)
MSAAVHAATPIEVGALLPSVSVMSSDVDWPYYNRDPTGSRFSSLSEINSRNIARLEEHCRVRVSEPGPFSSSIAMVNGTLYVTSRLSTIALDATTCDILWKSNYTLEEPQVFNTHRGVGYADGLVVRGTTDGRLLAYDAVTGQERWRTKFGDPKAGEFISSAPQIWDGKIFVGIAGSDWGIQGRVAAFDLQTGRQLWSFHTIPAAGEPGAETWAGESWKRGGGGTWTSYTIDPASGELFVPVGNPAMSWNGEARAGANLYSNSVLVLDGRTGKYLWHYQALAHDTHDFDLTSPPILAKLANGREILAVTPKNGLLYVIDRHSHHLIYKVAATTILNTEPDPTTEGVRFCPGIFGGSEWNGPAFDVPTQSLLTAQTDWCTTVNRLASPPAYAAGKAYMGGTYKMDDESAGWVTSFDAGSGKMRWHYRTPAPITSGVTPTAGDLTFVGDMAGTLYAFRTSTGELLRKIDAHGAIAGGVVTYRTGGRQYLAVTSGNISRSSWPAAGGIPSVVIYALPDANGASSGPDPGDTDKGRRLFSSICSGCHGDRGSGGTGGPALGGIGQRDTYAALVDFIEHPKAPMPALFPGTLSQQDVRDVARYVDTLR